MRCDGCCSRSWDIAGCQQGQAKPVPPAAQTVTSGSTLLVTAPFVIPRAAPGVYFQDTELRATPDLRRELAYCYFQLGPAAAAARTIGPQAFTVTGVEYDEQARRGGGRLSAPSPTSISRAVRSRVRNA